jgi:transcription antitermination factor NusG
MRMSETLAPMSGEGEWWAVQSKPHQEGRAEASLRAGGIATFLPLARRMRPRRTLRGGSWAVTVEPLFPRYLFARSESPSLARTIRFARGVARVLGTEAGPLPVDASLIDAIRARLAADGIVELAPALRPGDRVEVVAGPLTGFIGIFDSSLGGPDRVRLLLAALHGDCRVVVAPDVVRPLVARA